MSKKVKAMKPLLLKTSYLLLHFSLLFILSGCLNKDPVVTIRESGFFRFIVVGESTSLKREDSNSSIIVGFTDSGQEQETLDIPREIDGHPVKRIGLRDEGFYHNRSIKVYCSDKLRIVYIFDNIERIEYFYGEAVDLMICSDSSIPIEQAVSYNNFYYYKPLFDYDEGNSIWRPANINFMNNYPLKDDGGLYRLDNIETDESIPEPPDPILDGYQFTGWYTELECANKWDFAVAPTIEENEDLTLFAG